ncbi:MAG TPA: hypothetical protein VER12_19520 [Polyangiaceae bacterium]|nr:hypothetical protein [Polyangiaceae bacterium]
MRQSLFSARGLAWVAALVLASPLASAAPAKRGKSKPKHPAPAAAADSTPATAADNTSAKTEDPTPPKADESTLANPEPPAPTHESPSSSATSVESAGSTSLTGDTSLVAVDEEASKAAHEALGRREAERLAAGRSEVGVYVSVDVGNRRFKYSDPVSSTLRPYTLPIAPMLSFGLEAYPLATTDVPVLRDLGFRGRLSRAFALDSTTPDGDTIETSWTRFGGEVRERLLVPGRHPLEFGAFFGADASYFVMGSKGTIGALLPSARTISLRFGLDGRVLVAGRFSAMLNFAYLAVTSPGYIYDHFRDPHVAGIDGELGGALAIIPGLEARLTGRYTRYFATFHPQVGDQYVAGGSLDEQLQVGLGVRYAH